jgi:hypothetical protein
MRLLDGEPIVRAQMTPRALIRDADRVPYHADHCLIRAAEFSRDRRR